MTEENKSEPNVSSAITKLINSEPDSFVQLLPEIHRSKELAEEVKDQLSSCGNDDKDIIWKCLGKICEDTLLSSCIVDDSQEEKNKFDAGCSVLHGIATLVLFALEDNTENIPKGLTQSALILNGILVSLPKNQFKLKNAIMVFCEKWWSKDIIGKEKLFLNLLIYFLEKVSVEKYLKSDLKRLWSLRYGYNLIALKSESAEMAINLIHECMKSPNFLNNTDGLKILSSFLCLNEEITLDLHGTVKENISYCSKSQARAYGQVYNKAWSCVEGNLKDNLETNCIQDFMFHAIHAKANPNSPFANLKEFLSTFHSLHHHKDVGEMLFRLYEPILWRSFKVPSSVVRCNAAAILIDSFPLESSELSIEENNEWREKQFAIITGLLTDSCPTIRMIATNGVGIVCDRYWGIIPTDVIHKWIMTLIDELRLDTTSTTVRVNVFKGLSHLLNNPLSHQFLKTVLPKIRDSFHDVSESVRIAVIELLLKLVKLKSFEYWNIVPPNHLFARLAIETPPVSRRIVKLLKPSFFPKSNESFASLERTIFLIKTHRAASRKFYRFVHEFMDLKESVSFLMDINPCLERYVKKKFESFKKELVDINEYDNENDDPNVIRENTEEDDNNDNECLDDPEILTGLIDVVGIIWAGIHPNLHKPENTKLEKLLQNAYQDTVECFVRCCKENSCWESIIFLTSFLPPNQISSVCKHCLLRIRSLPVGATFEVFGTYVVNLCRWDFIEELCDILSLWLSAGLNPHQSSTVKKRSRKGVRFIEPYDQQPSLACDILCWMLEEPYCQEMLLFNRAPVIACWQQLESCLSLIEKRLNEVTKQNCDSDIFLEKAFNTYCRITIILHENPQHKSTRLLSEVLEWATKVLLPKLMNLEEQDDDIKLCILVIQSMLLMLSDMALVSLLTPIFTEEILHFAKNLLELKNNHYFFGNISRLLYQIIEFYLTRNNKETFKEFQHMIPDTISIFIGALARKSFEPNSSEFEISEIMKLSFIEIIESHFKHKALKHFTFKDILSTFVVAILSDLAADVKKREQAPVYEYFNELPFVSQLLISVFTANARFLALFFSEIRTIINSKELNQFPGPYIVATIIGVIAQENKYSKMAFMKSTLEAAETLLNESKLSPDFEQKLDDNDNITTNFNINEMAKTTAILLNEISEFLKRANDKQK